MVVVKQGPRGALACSSSCEIVRVPALDVAVIDTIGAGDAFNAGYLASVAAGQATEEALRRGVKTASAAISAAPRVPEEASLARQGEASMSALVLDKIRKRFDANEVLKGIDISLADGEFLVLLGPSGCGKSTLLNIIAGLLEPTSGDVRIGDRSVLRVRPKNRDIAMVFQSYALYPNMSVERNIGFGLEMRGVPAAERREAVHKAAAMLHIEPLLKRRPGELSGGQRQRVAIGRALVRKPAVFLFDEPLSNLDAKLRMEMRGELRRLHDMLGTTIVYVTHDQIEAMTLASRIALMHNGLIEQIGTPDEITTARPTSTLLASSARRQ